MQNARSILPSRGAEGDASINKYLARKWCVRRSVGERVFNRREKETNAGEWGGVGGVRVSFFFFFFF